MKMKKTVASFLTILITALLGMIGRLPTNIEPWQALLYIAVLWLVIRGLLAMFGGSKE